MPVDATSILVAVAGAAGLVGAAAVPTILQARRWKKEDEEKDITLQNETTKIDADAAQALVAAAGQLVTNALNSQVQADKDRTELRAQADKDRAEWREQVERLETAQQREKAANERIIEGLRQDHSATLRKVKSDYESEFEALHRQIGGLVLQNGRLEEQLHDEQSKNKSLLATITEQQEKITTLEGQVSRLQTQLSNMNR